MELIYSAIVLRKKELSFLAGAMGIKRLYGILDSELPDDAELYGIMSSLIRKGFVTPDGDSFVIDADIRRYIEIMEASEKPIFIYDSNGLRPPKCVYSSGDISVICETCHASEDELSVYELGTNEAQRLISSNGYTIKEGEQNDDTDRH